MTEAAAFRATYADWKLIRTRQSVQIVFEIPLSEADAAYDVLGGMPDSARERWFGIAPLNSTVAAIATPAKQSDASKPKRDWRDLGPAQQAGIRCEDPIFIAFLREQYSDDFHALEHDPAETVRFICGVSSRSKLNTEQAPCVIWHQLDEKFEAWKALERAS